MTLSICESDLDAFAADASTEAFRFRSILARLLNANGDDRRKLRNSLVEYLRFSPRSDDLINALQLGGIYDQGDRCTVRWS